MAQEQRSLSTYPKPGPRTFTKAELSQALRIDAPDLLVRLVQISNDSSSDNLWSFMSFFDDVVSFSWAHEIVSIEPTWPSDNDRSSLVPPEIAVLGSMGCDGVLYGYFNYAPELNLDDFPVVQWSPMDSNSFSFIGVNTRDAFLKCAYEKIREFSGSSHLDVAVEIFERELSDHPELTDNEAARREIMLRAITQANSLSIKQETPAGMLGDLLAPIQAIFQVLGVTETIDEIVARRNRGEIIPAQETYMKDFEPPTPSGYRYHSLPGTVGVMAPIDTFGEEAIPPRYFGQENYLYEARGSLDNGHPARALACLHLHGSYYEGPVRELLAETYRALNRPSHAQLIMDEIYD